MRDHTGLWVASLGWMDGGVGVSECVLFLGKRVEWLLGDWKDWLQYSLLYVYKIFPFLPRPPATLFLRLPYWQVEPHDYLLASGMRAKRYKPLPSLVHKDQLNSLHLIFLCLLALCQCPGQPWKPRVAYSRIHQPEFLNNCVKLSSQAPLIRLYISYK